MRESIPYEKEIVFNTKIAEITSISLEYEANVLDDDIEVIDIKYQVAVQICGEEQIYCFSSMIIYTKKEE